MNSLGPVSAAQFMNKHTMSWAHSTKVGFTSRLRRRMPNLSALPFVLIAGEKMQTE